MKCGASGDFELVIYGHAHEQGIRKVGKALVINPGDSTDWLTDKSAVIIVELDSMSMKEIWLVSKG